MGCPSKMKSVRQEKLAGHLPCLSSEKMETQGPEKDRKKKTTSLVNFAYGGRFGQLYPTTREGLGGKSRIVLFLYNDVGGENSKKRGLGKGRQDVHLFRKVKELIHPTRVRHETTVTKARLGEGAKGLSSLMPIAEKNTVI